MKRDRRHELAKLLALLLLPMLFVGASALDFFAQGQEPKKPLDPAAWGGNHLGRPVPEYVSGDECLFCHRNDIGTTWQNNAHGVTVRQREDAPELEALLKSNAALNELAPQISHFLGSRHQLRLLRKEGYGKFTLLSARAVLNAERKVERWEAAEKPAWDKNKFADRCAGCHTTGIDSKAKTFTAFGLDCYVCHGDATLEHTKDTALMLLSKKRRNDAKVITSLCAQCHLRESTAKSTGLPYPNNFIAGDNLFQDLRADWQRADDAGLNAGDRHVWRSAREVAVAGSETTCLNCHAVHANTSQKHRRLPRAPICFDCHSHETDAFKQVKRYVVKSALCEY